MALETDNNGNFILSAEKLDVAISRCNILIGLCQENNIPMEEAMLAVAVFVGRALAEHDDWDSKRVMTGFNSLAWRNYVFHRGIWNAGQREN